MEDEKSNDELGELIEKIFGICETHGSDYQAAELRNLLIKFRDECRSLAR